MFNGRSRYLTYRNLKRQLGYCKWRMCSTHLNNSQFLYTHDVIVSSSHDIYLNLAFEDWIYKNCDFSSRNYPLLMIWRNSPCVVIGRHQNPWTECRLSKMNELKVALARRNSGGGTVYHDLGNLNCTFFTERSQYNRKNNLNLICDALRKRWPLNLSLSSREDVLLNDTFKISGTAAKLGRLNAYHHFTVLFAADKKVLSSILKSDSTNGIESKASKSIRSPVKNLQDVVEDIDFESITQAIDSAFRQQYPSAKRPIRFLTPDENEFQGLTTIRQDLLSWEWLFGKCPPFTLMKEWLPWSDVNPNLSRITGMVKVRGGIIEDIKCQQNNNVPHITSLTVGELIGKRFPQQQFALEELFRDLRRDSEKAFLFANIAEMISEVL